MLTAKVTMRQKSLNLTSSKEVEFETLKDLEHFIAYNRNAIISLSFTGELNQEIEVNA